MKNKHLKLLEKKISINFNDIQNLELCLIHKSFSSVKNNEKLEFLGDRVLGLIISKKLIEIYPNQKEGVIDKKFANLVNKKTCANIAKLINLKNFMILGESYVGLSRSDEKILSACLEALIGAIYLDQGFKNAEKFVLKYWKTYIDKSEITQIDPKTKLQEYSLKKFKELPKYSLNKQMGPHHSPIFKVNVQIPNSKKYSGSGNSKKKAQQEAAKKLLQHYNLL